MGYSRHAFQTCPAGSANLSIPSYLERSVKIDSCLNRRFLRGAGLSSIGSYSYRRASNQHGSAPHRHKSNQPSHRHGIVQPRRTSTERDCIITSSFAAIVQVWGKIGAVPEKMTIFPRNDVRDCPIIRLVRDDPLDRDHRLRQKTNRCIANATLKQH